MPEIVQQLSGDRVMATACGSMVMCRSAAVASWIAALLTDQRVAPARRAWWRWQRKLSIAVAVWAAVCGPVLAAAGDGNELLAACLRPAETFDRGYCLGYIVGAAGALELEASVCPPKGITLGQLKDVVVRYLQAHPEIRHQSATFLTSIALIDAFPCRH